jgi:hypothetical protein
MKTNLKTILALLALGAATLTLRAQDDAPPQPPGQPKMAAGTTARRRLRGSSSRWTPTTTA